MAEKCIKTGKTRENKIILFHCVNVFVFVEQVSVRLNGGREEH